MSYKYLVAKNDIEEQKWLPLWVHSLDTYYVMQYLLDQWMSDSGIYALNAELPKEKLKTLTGFLALFHDFGKASMTFQSKIIDNNKELRERFLLSWIEVPNPEDPDLRDSKDMPHSSAGEIMLLAKGCPQSISAIVGAHHGRPWEKGPNVKEEIMECLEEGAEEELHRNFSYGLRLWGNKKRREAWIATQNGFGCWALEKAGVKSFGELPEVSDTEAVLLTGLLIMADWLASNEEYFPLIPYEMEYPENMAIRAEQACEKIQLPPVWQPTQADDPDQLTKDRFGFLPNSVQKAVLKTVSEGKETGLLVLEAPMGIGKTEAALLAAEEFPAERVAGMVFALPTQATANGIFSRVLEWGQSQTEQNRLSIRLAHGMASLNEKYLALMDQGKHTECAVDDYENARLIVHDFFQGNKQALLADFVVGTIDQILLATLKQKHFMLRHLGLAGKVVILDECHAYDAYMNEYIERTLHWLGRYHTPVIMLSATLPYERRAALIDAYLGYPKEDEDAAWRHSQGYPLLTWTDGSQVFQKEIEYSGDTREAVIEKLQCGDALPEQIRCIIALLSSKLNDGGCAGVVVNTVARAQTIAEAIQEALPEKRVILLHSRFITEDRFEKENCLLRLAGKKSAKDDRNGLIVVGTQVIEQSLDFDVDLLITDLCPMDLLLQRIGRLHRHPVHDAIRPKDLRIARCYILGAGENLDSGAVAVYGAYLLMRTRCLLPDKVLIPGDISTLVQKVYDPTYTLPKEPEGYEKAKLEQNHKRAILKKDADAFRIDPPGRRPTINYLLEAAVINNEDHARAQVRNGQEAKEVVVLFEKDNRLSRTPWRHDDELDMSICPTPEMCKAISGQRLRLPVWATGMVFEDELNMPEEWSKSVWLRNKLLLIMNREGETQTRKVSFKYSKQKGLEARRIEQEQ